MKGCSKHISLILLSSFRLGATLVSSVELFLRKKEVGQVQICFIKASHAGNSNNSNIKQCEVHLSKKFGLNIWMIFNQG